MSKRIKDFIEIADRTSLDALIARLTEIRDALSVETEAELKLCGDDIFGRYLGIGFMRPQTAEEAECEARYASASRRFLQSSLDEAPRQFGSSPLPRLVHGDEDERGAGEVG
jgi:hypothetical protein